MKVIRKILFISLLIIPLCLFIPVFTDIKNRKLYVFPSAHNLNYIDTLTDSIWNGTSIIKEFAYDSEKLLFKYVLNKSSYPQPRVFIIFWLDNLAPTLDVSMYTDITLYLKEATPQEVRLFIKTFEPGISSFNHQDAVSLRHNTKVITLSPDKKKYSINLNDFSTPGWWVDTYASASTDNYRQLDKETFKTVVSFDLHFIHESDVPFSGKEESLIIGEIFFHRSIHLLTIIFAIVLLLYYSTVIILLIVFRDKVSNFLKGSSSDSLPYNRESDFKRIIEYIQQHYNDPAISTIQLQEKLGIPSLRIFNLIKDEYNVSFKQLINKIRIQESKRLLRDSDLRIVEISSIIGFNDSSYFNKVFKQMESITPTEFREKK